MASIEITAQEAFNTAALHMLRQNAKCTIISTSICVYRGEKGMKCAVGALIPDELYKQEWDDSNLRVGQLITGYDLFPDNLRDLLHDLQIIHDEEPVDLWQEKLRILGTDYYLDTSAVTNFKLENQ